MNKTIQHELYAEVLQTLIEHLRNRNDVQNIDLMNLSGFCRNCLSKWYVKAAEKIIMRKQEKLFTVCHILNGRQNTKQKQQKNN